MAADEDTATADDGIKATLSMRDGAQTVQLPAGWELPGTEVRVRRVGASVVLEPIAVASATGEASLHTGWPPGYWEWLRSAQESGDLEIGDAEDLRIGFREHCPE